MIDETWLEITNKQIKQNNLKFLKTYLLINNGNIPKDSLN
jgi:hypothetical protein